MRILFMFIALAALLWAGAASNDGLSDVVTWDPYSLTVNGSRVFVLYDIGLTDLSVLMASSSGEFHYQRMPVPEMWLVGLDAPIQSQMLTIIRIFSKSSVPMGSMLLGKYLLSEIVSPLTLSAYISSGLITRLQKASTISKRPGRISSAYLTTRRKLGCG